MAPEWLPSALAPVPETAEEEESQGQWVDLYPT
jgi:hypothetical protein